VAQTDHTERHPSDLMRSPEGRCPTRRATEAQNEETFEKLLENPSVVTSVVTFLVTTGAHGGLMTCVLMAAMDREWVSWGHSSTSRTALRAVGETEPVVARLEAEDLGDVVRLVRRGPGGLAAGEAGKVVAALLRAAPAHPLIARAVVQCLVVGVPREIKRLGQMVRAWGSFDDALGEALAVLGMVVMEWAGEDRPYAALDVLSAVRCRLRRQIVAELAHRDHETAGTLETRPTPGRSAIDELAEVLSDPASSGLRPDDAALVALIAVHGYKMSEVAAMTGRSQYELARQKERAARCLVA